MRTFMTFFAVGLMLAATSTAWADNSMGKLGHAYTTPGRPAAVYAPVYRAPALTTAPAAVTGTRSLSVEPGTLPAAMPTRVVVPTYRNPHPNTPAWLLPKTDAHKFST